MKIYTIKTLGICDIGTGIVVAENEEKARELFEKYYPVEDNNYENKIKRIDEISLEEEKIVFYDDGDR